MVLGDTCCHALNAGGGVADAAVDWEANWGGGVMEQAGAELQHDCGDAASILEDGADEADEGYCAGTKHGTALVALCTLALEALKLQEAVQSWSMPASPALQLDGARSCLALMLCPCS